MHSRTKQLNPLNVFLNKNTWCVCERETEQAFKNLMSNKIMDCKLYAIHYVQA